MTAEITAEVLAPRDPRWADPATVHAIAAIVDPKRPCMFCGVAFHDHPGVLTVIPDEVDPETPALLGSEDCARRWINREPAPPRFRPVAFAAGVATYGREGSR